MHVSLHRTVAASHSPGSGYPCSRRDDGRPYYGCTSAQTAAACWIVLLTRQVLLVSSLARHRAKSSWVQGSSLARHRVKRLAGVTSLFRSEPEPVSEPDLVSTTQGRGDDDMRVGFDPNRTITESLALSRGAADTIAPGSTTQDMALSQIMDRAENLTGKDKAVASLETLIATKPTRLGC